MFKTALFDCAINEKCCSVDGGRDICPLFSSPPRGISQLKSPQPREFAIQGKINANARGVGSGRSWNWLMHKIGWTHGKNYSTKISNQGAQADLKMYKTSKIKYSQMRHFLVYRVQNVPENSSKTSLLGGVSKQAKRSDRPWWKFRVFEFLEGQFYIEKPPFVNLKKTKHCFEVSFPICVF